MGWAALPVTDRRWAAPLSAVALGFGIFAGVAIGPGAAGTLATGAAQLIEIPALGGGDESGEAEATAEVAPSPGSSDGGAEGAPEASSFAFSEGEFESSAPEAGPPPSPAKVPAPDEEPEPEKRSLSGVVVHVNPAAGSYTLAEAKGALDVVHAGKLPRPTTKLSVPVRPLANETFAEAGTRKRAGSKVRANLEGIVTYVDETPGAPAYTVSKRGVSVLVHVHPDPTTGAAPELPALGALARVAVGIEKSAAASESPSADDPGGAAPAEATQSGCAPDPASLPPPAIKPSAVLWQRHLSADGAALAYADFEGVVMAACPEAGQLLVSADDVRESESDLLFDISGQEIDLSRLRVGDSILATATIGVEGALSLSGLGSDEHMGGADDVDALQGDLAEAQP